LSEWHVVGDRARGETELHFWGDRLIVTLETNGEAKHERDRIAKAIGVVQRIREHASSGYYSDERDGMLCALLDVSCELEKLR
jgi:hypothetical protein